MAFEEIGVGIRFKGEGIDEVAILESIDEELFVKKVGDAYLENFKKRVGEEVVGVDPQYFRPTEVELLIGRYEGTYSFRVGTGVFISGFN